MLSCDAKLDFGPVEVGTTVEASVTCRNLEPESSVEIAELAVEGDSFRAIMPVATTTAPDAVGAPVWWRGRHRARVRRA